MIILDVSVRLPYYEYSSGEGVGGGGVLGFILFVASVFLVFCFLAILKDILCGFYKNMIEFWRVRSRKPISQNVYGFCFYNVDVVYFSDFNMEVPKVYNNSGYVLFNIWIFPSSYGDFLNGDKSFSDAVNYQPVVKLNEKKQRSVKVKFDLGFEVKVINRFKWVNCIGHSGFKVFSNCIVVGEEVLLFK